MPRLEPLPLEAIGDLQPSLEAAKSRMGFLPNSQLIMARRPEILRAFQQLGMAINGPSSTITPELRNMVSQMASRAAGCGYCMAHTAHTATRVGIPPEKEAALWEYETSPLFSAAERAALRVAQGAAQVPNAVTDDDFAELKRYYTEAQIVDIMAVIALFGFLNRFNDTMATELESSPIAAGQRFLA
ncbi:MAG TPA: carboxymuconolactone decarboxylase family protein, partial [Stellaceae bacterium]|nr:carboxymuconolactone decarboxylase family protein [Stellaceae bacterium]